MKNVKPTLDVEKKIIDVRNVDYEEWERLFFSEKHYDSIFPNMCFPSEQISDRYLNDIKNKSDLEVRNLLRKFLLKTVTLGSDHRVREYLIGLDNTELKSKLESVEYFRRLFFSASEVWEGLTWILDLLPSFPKDAIKGINAYFLANCQFMPDFVFTGISDCTAIIRAKYFEIEHPNKLLLEIEPHEFELLIEALYKEMGFQTKLTQHSYDGGIDIICEKKEVGEKEITLIQCKRYKSNIGVATVRELAGVVADRKATKGVVVTTANFTREAIKFSASNPSIELISYPNLNRLLNMNLNSSWPVTMDAIFRSASKKSREAKL